MYICADRGATVARIVGHNVLNFDCFETEVTMWVFEEIVNGSKLSEIINKVHENIKYLPGIKLPINVVCTTYVLTLLWTLHERLCG